MNALFKQPKHDELSSDFLRNSATFLNPDYPDRGE